MIERLIFIVFLFSLLMGQKRTPAMYWESLEMKEKVSFINGVYASGA